MFFLAGEVAVGPWSGEGSCRNSRNGSKDEAPTKVRSDMSTVSRQVGPLSRNQMGSCWDVPLILNVLEKDSSTPCYNQQNKGEHPKRLSFFCLGKGGVFLFYEVPYYLGPNWNRVFPLTSCERPPYAFCLKPKSPLASAIASQAHS